MTPSVIQNAPGQYSSYTQLLAPGNVDPNHLDGIGALWLVAHLSSPIVGAAGALNLTDATIDLTIKGDNFNPNGAKLYFWICSYLPGTDVQENYYAGLAVTNWAFTGDNLATQITSNWQTLQVTLDTNPADWTYAGNNVSSQGDWADRYEPLDLATTLSNVNATLHLVLVTSSPSQQPSGYLDIENITINTQTPAVEDTAQLADPQIVYGLENTPVTGVVTGDSSIGTSNVTYTLVPGSATNGSVTLDPNTGAFTFTPNTDYYGPTDYAGAASFQYTVSNGTTTDTPQTVDFFIGAEAQTPVINPGNENVEIAANTPFNFTLFSGTEANGSNPTFATLSFVVVPDSVQNGTLSLDSTTGRYTFTPTSGFSGTASFQYYDTDGKLNSAVKTVTITVDPSGTSPTIPTYNTIVNEYLVPGDLHDWTYWVVRLADMGDPNAAYQYGLMLIYGQNGITMNAALGATYLAEAVGTVVDASLQLAQLYISGTGVTKDYATAQTILNGVASSPAAQYELGVLDNLGFGTPAGASQTENDVSAAAHYLQAASQGEVDAMYTLGRRYLSGTGVAVDPTAAYFWLETALKYGGGSQGSLPQFIQLLNYDAGLASAQLTSDQVAAITTAVANWAPGQPTPYDTEVSYSYSYSTPGTFSGLAYASYENYYSATGVLYITSYYDGSGNLLGSESFGQNGSYSITLGGNLVQSYTVNSDGSYSYEYYIPGNFNGLNYAAYADQYTSGNVRDSRTYYDSSGNLLGSQTFPADGSYDDRYYTAGTFSGVNYASYDTHYNTAGFRDLITFYDASGNVLASESFTQRRSTPAAATAITTIPPGASTA
jgi:TPR repeat protein